MDEIGARYQAHYARKEEDPDWDMNFLLSIAGDGKFSEVPSQNLCGYVEHSPRYAREQALRAIGRLGLRGTIPFLIGILDRCRKSLKDGTPLDMIEGHGYPVGSSICETLAMLDCEEAHSILMDVCNRRGDTWLRFGAISAMGFEVHCFEESMLRKFLNHRTSILRLGAVEAIYEMRWHNPLRYAQCWPLALPMLKDSSPRVVIWAVDVLMGASDQKAVERHLWPLLKDHRYSKPDQSTVAAHVACQMGWEES